MPNTSCYHCGYSLVGLLDAHRRGTCPECGQKHTPRQRPSQSQLTLRWQVPLGIAIAAITFTVFVTVMTSVRKTEDGLVVFMLILPTGVLLWVATWITWANTDPDGMRLYPGRTTVTGAFVGIGVGTLTVIVQICLILATVMVVAAIRQSGP